MVPRPGRRLSRGRARHRLPARRYRGNAGDDRRHRRRCRQDLGAAADRRAARSTTGDHPLAAGRPVADRRWAQRYWQATDPWPGGGTDLKKAVALTRPFFPAAAEASTYLDRFVIPTERFVDKEWGSIMRVALALAEHRTRTGAALELAAARKLVGFRRQRPTQKPGTGD